MLTFVIGAVMLVVGVIFGQTIKDFIAGIPATVRADVAAYEAKAVAAVKAKL